MHTLPSHATPTTSSAMCDRRGTSFASEVDAAIERVVAHFEENDLALRLDVLRSLSAHAKLAFEAERIRERLRQHPATKELVDCVATQSKVFEQLTDSLRVDDCSCDYDAQRNVVMSTTTRWSLPSTGATKAGDRKKKRRKGESAASSAKLDAPLLVHYSFSRKLNEEGETELQLTVTARLGDDSAPSEIVHFAMASASPYPRSFYEEVREFGSDDEGEEGKEYASDVEVSSKPSKGGKPARKQSDASVKSTRSHKSAKSSIDEAVDEDDGNDDEGEEGESYGEAILAFRFDDKVLDEIMTWLKEHDTKYGDEIDQADVIGFFLAPPVHEHEWLLDERICEILFSSGAEFTDEEGGEEGSEVEGVGEGEEEEEEVDNE